MDKPVIVNIAGAQATARPGQAIAFESADAPWPTPDLYLRGAETLLASWEEYARGATGAAVQRSPGVATGDVCFCAGRSWS